MSDNEPPLLDISQEYIHVTGTFWRSEQYAYCRFDKQGDWDHVVSITGREPTHGITLVSFKRQPLEEYLAASNSVLVRLFDFSVFNPNTFTQWPDGDERRVIGDQSFFFRQKVAEGYAGYTRGVQIVRPARPRTELFSSITGHGNGGTAPRYVEFLAQDWRNRRVANISTDPCATTNYFEAGQNSLPFELSPAFFRPEVLLKYREIPKSTRYATETFTVVVHGRCAAMTSMKRGKSTRIFVTSDGFLTRNSYTGRASTRNPRAVFPKGPSPPTSKVSGAILRIRYKIFATSFGDGFSPIQAGGSHATKRYLNGSPNLARRAAMNGQKHS